MLPYYQRDIIRVGSIMNDPIQANIIVKIILKFRI